MRAQTVSPSSLYWTQLSATGPAARFETSMAYDPVHNQMVLFGGAPGGKGTVPTADTWLFNGTSWTQVTPATSPSARDAASMVYDPSTQNILLFGGRYGTSTTELGDTWTWNGTTWTQLSPANSPSGRSAASMAYDSAHGVVVLFGGYAGSYVTDTWTWNGTTWTQQSPAAVPGARGFAGMAYDAALGKTILFGGTNGTITLNDTWGWDGTNWTQQAAATSPAVRQGPGMVYHPLTGTVLLFGGYYSSTNTVYSDTWSWDGTNWTKLSPSPAMVAEYLMGADYDQSTQKIVTFGGYSLSVYSSATATLGGTYIPPTPTTAGAAVVAPTTAVGSAAAQTAVSFTLGSSVTYLPTLSNNNVVTTGISGLDFTLGTGSTCTGAVTANSACTINVAFKPTAPGLRLGAVNLLDSNNNVLATGYISGLATGPLAATSPGLITTVAGNGHSCSSPSVSGCGNGGAATSANISYANGVAVDAAGNLYIADFEDYMIRKVSAATGLITTVAGSGTQCVASNSTCGDGTLATSATAELSLPNSVAVDGAGNLYIADAGSSKIRKVTAATGLISTVAGNGTACSTTTAVCGDGGAATAANLNFPQDVRVDAAGNLYIADSGDNRIRYVSASTGIITTLAGTGATCSNATSTTNPCGDNSVSTSSGVALNFPSGLALDAAGNLYIADTDDQRIRKISASTGIITTVAGSGSSCTSVVANCGDGSSATASTAQLDLPYDVTIDAAGNLYVGDFGDNRIRKVSATGILSTVAGNGNQCSTPTAATSPCGDGTSATSSTAEFGQPWGVALDASGNLYIADFGDNRIRKVSTAATINFATPTTAGSADTTDGTQTATLNNIGNLPLVLSAQTESSSNFVLGNPMSGGCASNGTIAVGDSCLIGATFTPQTGQTGLLTGNIATTSNNLNASNAVTNTLLLGTPASNATNIAVNQVVATAGTASVLMGFQYGYTGAPDTGAQTITVNGSSAGVGAVSCVFKVNHANCSFNYTGTALSTPGSYTISVAIAASSPYSAFTGTNYMYINPVVTQGGGHSGAPVSGFATLPTSGERLEPASPITGERLMTPLPLVYADDTHPCADGTVVSHMACPAK